MANGSAKNYTINTISELSKEIESSDQLMYILSYLKELDVKTYIIENNYIDKDYIIDYSNFYARSFDVNDKYTKRIHFFNKNISADDFQELMTNYDQSKIDDINKSYLGFAILRPIQDSQGKRFFGRILLKTYPNKVNEYCRFYLTQTYNISLFGIPLTIKTLPFLPQDEAVGACATSACWVALHPLNSLFGIQKCSPYEITNLAISFPGHGRNFPSQGLTSSQMKSQFNEIGLETEYIKLKEVTYNNYTKKDDMVADAVKAYNNLGLPVIATLYLEKNKHIDYHAVVISGYRHKNGVVTEFYVHDDQIGPFHKVLPDGDSANFLTHEFPSKGNFSKWKNAWTNERNYEFIHVETLIIPIYSKLRLNFGRIYNLYLYNKRWTEQYNDANKTDLTSELFLTSVNEYKKHLLKCKFANKPDILDKPLPRFLWVIRLKADNHFVKDAIIDGTAVYPRLNLEIDYDTNQKDVLC
jgi:hypothetical protein